MRRLRVIQLLPALHSGGVERATLEIGRALVREGHESHVVSAGGRLVAQLLAEGSRHHTLAIGAKSPLTLLRIAALRRLLAALRPDLVHARSRLPAWLGLAALRGIRPRPPLVTSVHGLHSPGRYSGVMTRGERVVCVSETVRQHVLRHWPGAEPRLLVIPPGIDADEFPRRPRPDPIARAAVFAELGLSDATRLLLLPGRGTRLKGHGHGLRLLADLRAQGIAAALWLLGADEPGRASYLAGLGAEARALGVESALRLSPARNAVQTAYAACDLVLQLSDQPEAFGRTVLEALAVGAPVLGWAQGGVGENLARNYPAGLVDYGDRAALCASARQLLDSPPPVPATLGSSLAATQRATLDLYARLAG